ncbi:MAG TPA: ABC transporter permease subunit [Anaerolineales bacterium]
MTDNNKKLITATVKTTPFGPRLKMLLSAARFLLAKILMIGVTIFLGVFVTVLIANTPAPPGWGIPQPQFEASLETQIERVIRSYVYNSGFSAGTQEITDLRESLRDEAGLNLPYWQRHLLWTYKVLTFNWGNLSNFETLPLYGQTRFDFDINGIVLEHFPNTLLLIGVGNLIVFLLGIPLSLYLARHYGKLMDRLVSFFSPLSSVPSWVIGILLVAIFAVELRWFPSSGMFDNIPPDTKIGYIPILIRHMILPVTAIVLSLLFQLVTSWRTFFVIYSEEDYVDLAKAKGLSDRMLTRKYILRPTLPYIITSFSLVLVGFWQMTMALEVVFRWPGIGYLYIDKALPNFWGESMYPGELLIAVAIVVIFAYLLGIVVLLLDFAYVLVDPRVHIIGSENTVQNIRVKSKASWWRGLFAWGKPKTSMASEQESGRMKRPYSKRKSSFRLGVASSFERVMVFFRELRRYPSAIFGLTIILFLIIGSIYAVTAYPYEQIGRLWDTERLSGRAHVPRLAQPAWTNIFRGEDLLSVLLLNDSDVNVIRAEERLENGWRDVKITYTFEYAYGDFPDEIILYVDSFFETKRPFISLTWLTPDGRAIGMKSVSAGRFTNYSWEDNLNVKRLVSEYPNLQAWFNFGQVNTTPSFYVLFADPYADQPQMVKGTYQLVLQALLFEDDSTVESELVLLGQVYGVAGTDYLRRDLIVPLLWGMPFALAIGLVGAFLTTILAMLISATGVWFGGWVDNLIQRLTEINMVLPVLAVSVLAYAMFGIDIWIILGVIIILNVFGTPTKTFRSAFLQVKEAPYIEAARAYGTSNSRMIMKYLVPRIVPVLVPQLVALIPSFVFLEATLGLFNVKSNYPTWGRIIYQGLSRGALYGSRFWVLEPLALLLLTGLAFAMLGVALERILNPRLLEK